VMTGCSSKTVQAFEGFCRQLVSADLQEEDTIVGGDGIIVEIDECKLGKRKYNRGHMVDGVWSVECGYWLVWSGQSSDGCFL
jgi:hypothetical protein